MESVSIMERYCFSMPGNVCTTECVKAQAASVVRWFFRGWAVLNIPYLGLVGRRVGGAWLNVADDVGKPERPDALRVQ